MAADRVVVTVRERPRGGSRILLERMDGGVGSGVEDI
jgi:hypothetical protein